MSFLSIPTGIFPELPKETLPSSDAQKIASDHAGKVGLSGCDFCGIRAYPKTTQELCLSGFAIGSTQGAVRNAWVRLVRKGLRQWPNERSSPFRDRASRSFKAPLRAVYGLMIAVGLAGFATGCNTIEGLGQDVESAGEAVEEAAD